MLKDFLYLDSSSQQIPGLENVCWQRGPTRGQQVHVMCTCHRLQAYDLDAVDVAWRLHHSVLPAADEGH